MHKVQSEFRVSRELGFTSQQKGSKEDQQADQRRRALLPYAPGGRHANLVKARCTCRLAHTGATGCALTAGPALCLQPPLATSLRAQKQREQTVPSCAHRKTGAPRRCPPPDTPCRSTLARTLPRRCCIILHCKEHFGSKMLWVAVTACCVQTLTTRCYCIPALY